jgi:hypothetical protein
MRFAGDKQLDRTVRVSENFGQSLLIVQQQIGTLVAGKTAGEPESQRIMIEQWQTGDSIGRVLISEDRSLLLDPPPDPSYQGGPSLGSERPQRFVARATQILVESF